MKKTFEQFREKCAWLSTDGGTTRWHVCLGLVTASGGKLPCCGNNCQPYRTYCMAVEDVKEE